VNTYQKFKIELCNLLRDLAVYLKTVKVLVNA